ncbi:MAG: hypothetical protein ACK5MR_07360 [Cumulibacter sp.]
MTWWVQSGIVLAALLISVGVGWVVAVVVLRLAKVPDVVVARYERDSHGRAVPVLGVEDAPRKPAPLLRGGLWIGILERVAVTGAIIAGMPTLVALVVAVKGLGRYPELKEHAGASERFIIGTLASMIVAVGVGLLCRWVLDY